MRQTKAVALFSGGLDSVLAIKLIQEQGLKVVAVAFTSPFFIADEDKKRSLEKTAEEQGFDIVFIKLGKEYLEMLKNPKHGYGKNMNPCIDCHAFMIRKAKGYADKIGAEFVFTGEVLDERPMSQNLGSLRKVEKEAGIKGELLRPLSAKYLPQTQAEKKGIIDREKLMDMRGRGRKKQFELAERFGIKEYETPGGGCLLTYEQYSNKLKDLLKNKEDASMKDIRLLKLGRHFRIKDSKIIVGRDEEDNNNILRQKKEDDYVLEAKDCVGPITLLRGPKTEEAIRTAAQLTARYSDSDKDETSIICKNQKIDKEIKAKKIKKKDIEKIRI